MKKIKKEIVIINQDSGYLMIDIANAYVDKGYSVSLITGRLVERNKKLNEKVKISRIVKYNRTLTIKRLFTWGLGVIQILFLVIFKYRGHELLIVSNPPFATLIPQIIKNPFSLLIYDIYPDVLVESKMLSKNSFLIRKWKRANKKIFNKAQNIYTLNDQMKKVLEIYSLNKDIKVIPIWTDNTFLKPIDKNANPFIKEHQLKDKFVILYSGNLGKTHNIEILLDLADKINDNHFIFVIIGGGEQYNSIKSEINRRALKNIKLLPWQDPKMIPFSLSSADIGVVSLGNEASRLSIPSKTYNLMSTGVPILSLSDSNSALANLVEKNKIGKNFNFDEKAEILNFIKELKRSNTKVTFYKKNALETSKKFDSENAYKFVS